MTEAEDNLSPRHLEHIRDLENIDLSEPISNFDNSPLNKKETAELVRYYYRIQNRSTARQIFELIKSLAKESLVTVEEDNEETLIALGFDFMPVLEVDGEKLGYLAAINYVNSL